MNALLRAVAGRDIFARAARGAGWTALGFVGTQGLRFASNLLLTRLLFPEAFGLMTLTMVFITGLAMLSDVGLGPSVMQHRRGDEEDFLNTAWTIQVIRGFALWAATGLLALPAAWFYGEPILAQILPVAGFALVISGFNPTTLISANRHLLLGRMTGLELLNQVISFIILLALTWWLRSVWALVIGGVISSASYLLLARLLLPGQRNRFHWEPAAINDLVHFGKWIFLSTALGFFVAQGDKIILGKYLSVEMLGIYNIGYFLASFPLLLAGAVIARILIPLYREGSPSSSPESFRRIRWMRFVLTAGVMTMLIATALAGVALIDFLYDPRYAAAGGIVVMIACVQMFQLVSLTYDQSALAAGDSRSYFVLFVARAAFQLAGLLTGLWFAGLPGAMAGQAVAAVATHGFVIWLARRHGSWDPLHDAIFGVLAILLAATALWMNRDAVMVLEAWAR
jgi:O-antigen/teichoic acid export membrane protein